MSGGRLGAGRLGAFRLGAPSLAENPPVVVLVPGPGEFQYQGFAPTVFSERTMRGLLGYPNATLRPTWRVRLGGTIYRDDSGGQERYGSKVFKRTRYSETPLNDSSAAAVVLDAISGSVELAWSWDNPGVARASVVLAESVALLVPQPTKVLPVCIELGYLGDDDAPLLEQVFLGYLQQVDGTHEPAGWTIQALGTLSRTQQPLKHQVGIHKKHHWQAVQKLLDAAAVPGYDLDGYTDNVGDTYTYKVSGGTPAAQVLGKWGHDLLYPLWDAPDGTPVSRRPALVAGNWQGTQWTFAEHVPGSTGYWSYASPPILEGMTRSWPRQQRRNRVKILGRMLDDPSKERAHTTRHDDSAEAINLIENPPHFLSDVIDSDVIEYEGQSGDLAPRHMRRANKVPWLVSIPTIGHPYLKPADVIQVYAPHLGLQMSTTDEVDKSHHVITGVSHEFGPDGFNTTIRAEGGKGAKGVTVDTVPHAFFSWEVSGPDADGLYRVDCDGSHSNDPDGTDPDAIKMEWWNNKNANTFSANYGEGGPTYVAYFTQADWDSGDVVITLRVTDDDRLWTLAKGTVNG